MEQELPWPGDPGSMLSKEAPALFGAWGLPRGRMRVSRPSVCHVCCTWGPGRGRTPQVRVASGPEVARQARPREGVGTADRQPPVQHRGRVEGRLPEHCLCVGCREENFQGGQPEVEVGPGSRAHTWPGWECPFPTGQPWESQLTACLLALLCC